MAILEINLEKPALVEEYQYPGEETEGPAEESPAESTSNSSGGGKAKLLGLLGVLAGVGLLVWKLKNRGSTEQTDFEEFEEPDYDEEGYEEDSYEFESEDESGGAKRKVAGLLGLAVGLVGLLAAVQKRRK
ncbi:hypothetical protein [Halorussus ruber]|uniref:hypothetical protein n=1 Tax=Halorussus ruber TaxID=1126238 RepID=UPI0010931B26|nr:hypothetical protein [Halorussus ruber]